MKYELDDEQARYVTEEGYVTISDFVSSLTKEQEELYIRIYASALLERIEESKAQVMFAAQSAILEYKEFDELYEEGYIRPSDLFEKEDYEMLDDCRYDEIGIGKWDWDEDMLLDYVVDSSWTNCSRDFGKVEIDGVYVYFDKDLVKNETIEQQVERIAIPCFQKIDLKEKLTKELSDGSKTKAQQMLDEVQMERSDVPSVRVSKVAKMKL